MNIERLISVALSTWFLSACLSPTARGEEPPQPPHFALGSASSVVVTSVAFSPNGQKLASGSWDKTLKLWEVGSGKLIRALEGHTNSVFSVAFSPDNETFASGSLDNTVKLWDVGSGKLIRTLKGHTNSIYSLAFSADGRTIASASFDDTVKLWEVGSGKLIRTLEGHIGWVQSVAFSTDGQTLASGGIDNTVKLWEVGSGKLIRTLEGHTNSVYCVAFSADGQTLASASWDSTLKLWEVGSGELIRTLEGHTGLVQSVAFSADGLALVSGSWDREVKLWEVETGKLVRTFEGHTGPVTSVALSADGQTLVSGSRDSSIRYWDLATGEMLATSYSFVADYVTYTPEGFYTASEGIGKFGSWWIGSEAQSSELFAERFRKPELVAQRISRNHAPQLSWVDPFPITTEREIRLTLAYHGRADLQKLWLFFNNQQLSIEAKGKKLIEIPLSLSEWKNVLNAIALDNNGVSSAPLQVQFEYVRGARPGPGVVAPFAAAFEVEISGGLPSELVGAEELEVNKRKVRVEVDPSQQKLRFLGDSSFLEAGVNWIKTLKGDFRFWWEEQKLTRMPSPYESSYAVVAAIDEYEEKKMGFERLDAMVARAQELVNALVKVGFPRENIITLYDRAATSANINRQLERFWKGGDLSSADRLFFYFGGHGAGTDGFGYLITSDYDPKRPGLTSFLMSDIVSRHFPNAQAKHMIVAIDSCSSGLAIPGMRSLDGLEEERLRNFRRLSVVLGDTANKARNLLVAGTGEEKALYENGGIFTRSLIDGLAGAGDLNKDGIIQFEELALQLRNEVRAKAATTGIKQEPGRYIGSAFGNGEVLFLTPAVAQR